MFCVECSMFELNSNANIQHRTPNIEGGMRTAWCSWCRGDPISSCDGDEAAVGHWVLALSWVSWAAYETPTARVRLLHGDPGADEPRDGAGAAIQGRERNPRRPAGRVRQERAAVQRDRGRRLHRPDVGAADL